MESVKMTRIRKFSHFQKQPPVNLEFKDLTYTIPQWRKEPKVLLHSISGQFGSGQLNAIMGPSGSGKTTLLNVLSGYKTGNTSGFVTINGQAVILKDFYKYSRYIMQIDFHQRFLTVEEAMMYAADFKLDSKLSKERKLALVDEILEMLGLQNAKDTKCEKLSGGERKRLSISLELINNPPVLFLDEPTSGLDEVSSSHCISLLKALAEGGRTIICAIHTPSAKIFEKFDNVYILSNGFCMYQGYGQNTITYLSTLGLPCPTHYNPADFIVEIASGEYGSEWAKKSTEIMENGKNVDYCKESAAKVESLELDDYPTQLITYDQNSSIFHQFKILTRRYFLQTCRDTHSVLFKTAMVSIGGIMVGLAYSDLNDGTRKAVVKCTFSYFCLMICLYISLLPILAWFPIEIRLVKRENFNKWYGLTAYYFAKAAITIPTQAVLTPIYIGLAYVLSNQPMELYRFFPYIFSCVLLAIASESLALVIASVFNIVHALFVGPVLAFPIMLLAVFGAGSYDALPFIVKLAMRFSFMQYGMELLTVFLYGYERPKLQCSEDEYNCIYKDPKFLLHFIGVRDVVVWYNFIIIILWILIFRIISFFILRYRLKTNRTVTFSTLFNKFY